MAFSKYLPILAALALGNVDAASVAPRDYNSDNNMACRPIVPPKGAICGVEGKVFAGKAIPLDDKPFKCWDAQTCADSCGMRKECTYFGFHDQGYCQTFTNYFSRSGYVKEAGTHGFFAERECFDCFMGKDNILDLDFTNYDPGQNWEIETDVPDSFFYDTLPRKNALDKNSEVFRILEVTDKGQALVKYKPDLNLTPGNVYRVGFNAGSNFVPRPTQGIPWKSLGVRIENNGKIIKPEPYGGGVELGYNWVRFEYLFEAENDFKGPAFLTLTVDATGEQVDWYIDDLYIRVLP